MIFFFLGKNPQLLSEAELNYSVKTAFTKPQAPGLPIYEHTTSGTRQVYCPRFMPRKDFIIFYF